MASVANISVGQTVGLNGATDSPPQAIAPGTIVTAVNSGTATVTLSLATVASIAAGTKIYFGTQTASASPLEVQRQAYNSFARTTWETGSPYCAGLIDVDGIVSDQGGSGKWRTDLGQASMDGVHPTTALHQAVVNAGLINPAMFFIP